MAANMSVAHALVADISRAEDRTRDIARLSGAAGLGFVAGPAIGGLLAGIDVGASVFLLPYLTAALFSGIALILAIVLIRETVSSEQKSMARLSAACGLEGCFFTWPYAFATMSYVCSALRVFWCGSDNCFVVGKSMGVGTAGEWLFLRLDGGLPCATSMVVDRSFSAPNRRTNADYTWCGVS